MARRRHPRHRGGGLESRAADGRSRPSATDPRPCAERPRPGLGSRRKAHGRHVELELGGLMVARPRRSRSRPDPAPNGWSRARLARRRRDRGSPWCAALTRAVGRITRSTALLSSNEAGGARLLASSPREAARSCGRSFYRDAVAYSGTLTRCSVSVAGALRACRNPRIARIPRSSPAITIATPAHRAIVATVHQP
jgi:hypothetical protein